MYNVARTDNQLFSSITRAKICLFVKTFVSTQKVRKLLEIFDIFPKCVKDKLFVLKTTGIKAKNSSFLVKALPLSCAKT